MYIHIVMDELKAISDTMIEACACLNLRKANRALTRFYDRLLSPSGIRSTQLPILTALASAGPVTLAQLAKLILVDQSTLTRNLKSLKERHLIRVQPGMDKRVREVSLTKQGKEIIRQVHPLWEEAQTRITEEIGTSGLEQLLEVSAAAIKATSSA